VITCSLGTRFRSYCSSVGRTYLIDPTTQQTSNYEALIEVRQKVIDALKPGNPLKEAMRTVKNYIQKSHPTLLPHLLPTCGIGMGIELEEPFFQLDDKNERVAKSGMVFRIRVGFTNLTAKNKKYALLLDDTVIIGDSESEVLTSNIPFASSEISYTLEGEDASEKSKSKEKVKEKS